MVDPTYSGQLDIPKPTKGKGGKGKKGSKEAAGYVIVCGLLLIFTVRSDDLFSVFEWVSCCYQSYVVHLI